jgi:hypothetical protein
MYIDRRTGATAGARLHLFQLGVAFNELLRATPRKTDGKAAVFIVAFDSDDGANSVIRVPNFLAEKGIGIRAASYGRPHIRG